jgi:hypothetical protein
MKTHREIRENSKPQLWVTAYHEAGHAVAAVALNVAIGKKGVSILSDQDSVGRLYTHKHVSGDPQSLLTGRMRLRLEETTIVSLAGEIAQRKYRPSSVYRHHAGSDRDRNFDRLSCMVGNPRELVAYWRWLLIRAENLVNSPPRWAQIEAVAKALVERKTLSASEVRQICVDALHRPVRLPGAI